jgi:CheY-like chemotaxis protein
MARAARSLENPAPGNPTGKWRPASLRHHWSAAAPIEKSNLENLFDGGPETHVTRGTKAKSVWRDATLLRMIVIVRYVRVGSENNVRRILVVDDHEVVRIGIVNLLKDSWDVCGQAANGLEAIEKVHELQPDLVLMDLRMPVMSGTEATRRIRAMSPKTKVVLLSMYESESVVELARLMGADACLSKRCAATELRKAIAAVLSDTHRPGNFSRLDPA